MRFPIKQDCLSDTFSTLHPRTHTLTHNTNHDRFLTQMCRYEGQGFDGSGAADDTDPSQKVAAVPQPPKQPPPHLHPSPPTAHHHNGPSSSRHSSVSVSASSSLSQQPSPHTSSGSQLASPQQLQQLNVMVGSPRVAAASPQGAHNIISIMLCVYTYVCAGVHLKPSCQCVMSWPCVTHKSKDADIISSMQMFVCLCRRTTAPHPSSSTPFTPRQQLTFQAVKPASQFAAAGVERVCVWFV